MGVFWWYALTNYVPKDPYFNDVSEGQQSRDCPSTKMGWNNNRQVYGINTCFDQPLVTFPYSPTNPVLPVPSLAQVKRRATTFLIAETYHPYPPAAAWLFESALDLSAGNYPRHGGIGLNFFFTDGHAEFLTRKLDTPWTTHPWAIADSESYWTYFGNFRIYGP